MKFFKPVSTLTYLTLYVSGNFVIIMISLYYLCFNEIFIFEQGRVSHYNNGHIHFLILNLIYFSIFFISCLTMKNYTKKQATVAAPFPDRKIYTTFFTLIILTILVHFANVALSWPAPIMSQHYISRFDYIETTRLWPILKVFGSTGILIPIYLGFHFFYSKLCGKNTWPAHLALISYIIYLVLIGHKFGALLKGLYLYFMPYIIHSSTQGINLITKKILIFTLMLLTILFGVVYYHYSQYVVAINFGGPLQFIFYRIFGLQGHVTWGIFDQLDKLNPAVENIWDGMNNMMIQVAGYSRASGAIDRGVRFAGGYPAILFYSFPEPVAYILHAAFSSLYIWAAWRLTQTVYSLRFVLYNYAFIYMTSFYTSGSLNLFINAKIAFLIILLFIYELILFISAKSTEITHKTPTRN